MKDITKYQGVIPAFYACYDAEGNISTEGVKALTRHLIAKGVKLSLIHIYPYVDNGIEEAEITTVLLSEASTAREGVALLTSIYDNAGAAGGSGVFLSLIHI